MSKRVRSNSAETDLSETKAIDNSNLNTTSASPQKKTRSFHNAPKPPKDDAREPSDEKIDTPLEPSPDEAAVEGGVSEDEDVEDLDLLSVLPDHDKSLVGFRKPIMGIAHEMLDAMPSNVRLSLAAIDKLCEGTVEYATALFQEASVIANLGDSVTVTAKHMRRVFLLCEARTARANSLAKAFEGETVLVERRDAPVEAVGSGKGEEVQAREIMETNVAMFRSVHNFDDVAAPKRVCVKSSAEQ